MHKYSIGIAYSINLENNTQNKIVAENGCAHFSLKQDFSTCIQVHNLVCVLQVGGCSHPMNENLRIHFGRLLMASPQPEERCRVCRVPHSDWAHLSWSALLKHSNEKSIYIFLVIQNIIKPLAIGQKLFFSEVLQWCLISNYSFSCFKLEKIIFSDSWSCSFTSCFVLLWGLN